LAKRLAKSSPQFAPALARGLATLGKRQELANISGNRGGGLPGRVSAAAALYDLDPAFGGRLVADLFAQPLSDFAVEELMLAVLAKAERGIALAKILTGRKISKGLAIHAARLLLRLSFFRPGFLEAQEPGQVGVQLQLCVCHDESQTHHFRYC
jgi:hypothetical protein